MTYQRVTTLQPNLAKYKKTSRRPRDFGQGNTAQKLPQSRLPLGTPRIDSDQAPRSTCLKKNSHQPRRLRSSSDNMSTPAETDAALADQVRLAELATAKLQRQEQRIIDTETATLQSSGHHKSRRQRGSKAWKPFDFGDMSDDSLATTEGSRRPSPFDAGAKTTRPSDSCDTSRSRSASRPASRQSTREDASADASDVDNADFQLVTGKKTQPSSRPAVHLNAHEVSSVEAPPATVAASFDKKEINEVFGNELPPYEFIKGNPGFKHGQVQFLQHPNGDVSAHLWHAEKYQWTNIGQFSNIRKKTEGVLASEKLKWQTAEQTLRQNTLGYFRAVAKQREAREMRLPFGAKEIAALMPNVSKAPATAPTGPKATRSEISSVGPAVPARNFRPPIPMGFHHNEASGRGDISQVTNASATYSTANPVLQPSWNLLKREPVTGAASAAAARLKAVVPLTSQTAAQPPQAPAEMSFDAFQRSQQGLENPSASGSNPFTSISGPTLAHDFDAMKSLNTPLHYPNRVYKRDDGLMGQSAGAKEITTEAHSKSFRSSTHNLNALTPREHATATRMPLNYESDVQSDVGTMRGNPASNADTTRNTHTQPEQMPWTSSSYKAQFVPAFAPDSNGRFPDFVPSTLSTNNGNMPQLEQDTSPRRGLLNPFTTDSVPANRTAIKEYLNMLGDAASARGAGAARTVMHDPLKISSVKGIRGGLNELPERALYDVSSDVASGSGQSSFVDPLLFNRPGSKLASSDIRRIWANGEEPEWNEPSPWNDVPRADPRVGSPAFCLRDGEPECKTFGYDPTDQRLWTEEQLDISKEPTPQKFDGPFFQSLADRAKIADESRDEELRKWFYGGNKRERQEEFFQRIKAAHTSTTSAPDAKHSLGVIGRPSLSTTSPEDKRAESMDFNETTTRLLIPVLENLSSYVQGPMEKRRGYFAPWVTPPEWCIDKSATGNDSFFGDDWGQPPERIGRDSRYRPFAYEGRFGSFDASAGYRGGTRGPGFGGAGQAGGSAFGSAGQASVEGRLRFAPRMSWDAAGSSPQRSGARRG